MRAHALEDWQDEDFARAAEPLVWEDSGEDAASAPDPAAAQSFPGLDALSEPAPAPPPGPEERPSTSQAPTAEERSEWCRRYEATSAILAKAGISAEVVQAHILPRLPQLVRLEPGEVEAAFSFLASKLGEESEAASAVIAEPCLLSYKATDHLAPGFQFLATMSAMDDEATAKVVSASPGMLDWAVRGVLRERNMKGVARAASNAVAGFAAAAAAAGAARAKLRR